MPPWWSTVIEPEEGVWRLAFPDVAACTFEVIVVDNGSPDDSEMQLRRRLDPLGITVIQTGENLGFSGGNNVAIRLALRRQCQCQLVMYSHVSG